MVAVQEEADVEGPAFPDPRRETGRTGRDVRLTLRDVILVRADAGVTVRERGSGQFQARLTVDLAGAAFALRPGVRLGRRRGRRRPLPLRHHPPGVGEPGGRPRPRRPSCWPAPAAATAEPVLIAGDLNSEADPPDPAYAVLTGGGFADTWRPDAGSGVTFGLTETADRRRAQLRAADRLRAGPRPGPRLARAEQRRDDRRRARRPRPGDRAVAVGPRGLVMARLADRRLMLDALSPPRRRLVLVLIGLVGALVLALAATLVVRLTRPTAAPVPQDQPGPVLLVPGYGGRVESLDPLAAALRAAGRDVRVVPRLGDGTGDLNAEAEHLAEAADQALSETGAPSVDVIGYSAGGVVARLWVRDHGGDGRARRVLTLGSPHHGTSQAALGRELAGGCPTACEQLVPDSDLLRRLNAGDETPGRAALGDGAVPRATRW